jgi:septum formation protein
MDDQRLKIILASGSPRRLELLKQAGVDFTVIVPDADETPITGESAKDMVERLALIKAETVARCHPEAYVIGADTTVCIDDLILGKPESKDAACEMLKRIQGRTHQVWGGISIVRECSALRQSWSHITEVTMRPMDDATIVSYVNTGEPMDKAGSYAIQGIGLQYVDVIWGSYSNVVGLNIATLIAELRGLECL